MRVVPIRASAFLAAIASLFALPLSARADSESHARYVAAVGRGHFTELYARAASTGLPLDIAVDSTHPLTASVTTEIVALQPTAEFAAEWWAAPNVPVDFAIEVTPELVTDRAFSSDQPMCAVVGEYLGMLGNLLISTWDIVTRWTSV